MEAKRSFLETPEHIALLTTVTLVGFGVLQIILGETVSRSVALTANGIDCIGDGFVSGIVWVGLRFLRKPADHKFHFGYYKIENLASIAAAIVMLLLAGYIGYRSYLQFQNPQQITLPVIGALVATIAAVVALGLGLYKYLKGKHSKLGSVKLDAFNTIKDGTTSFLTVIALLISSQGYPLADAVVGFIIAGIIVSIGFAAIKESSYMLLDACDHSCVDQQQVVRHIVEKIPGIQAVHSIRLRRSGPVFQGEIEVIVPGSMTVAELHTIQEEIQHRTRTTFPDIERLTVTALPEKKQ